MLYPLKYFILDSAKAESNIFIAKKLNPAYQSLYKGIAQEDLSEVSPYLFTLSDNSGFCEWYLEKGWGKSWGVIILSGSSFEDIYKHFRKFLMVKTEDGKELYFRFYDPRVLKIFLPTCDEKQILEFFGPVESFIVEGETKEEAIRFWQQNGILKQENLPVEKIFPEAVKTAI